jgi:hypothetical protein
MKRWLQRRTPVDQLLGQSELALGLLTAVLAQLADGYLLLGVSLVSWRQFGKQLLVDLGVMPVTQVLLQCFE